MAKNIFFMFLLGMIFVSCSSTGSRKISSSFGAEECQSSFIDGSHRFLALAESSAGTFTGTNPADIKNILNKMTVRCVGEKLLPFGFQIQKTSTGVLVELESTRASLSTIFDSNIGKAQILQYGLNPRTFYLDRVQTALAGHIITTALGRDDSRYDMFFLTLKTLEESH